MKYKWIYGMENVANVSAQSVGTELAKLEQANAGALLPVTVVRAARPKRSRLHSCFEWDDKTAAERYRLKQAGEMLRKIAVVYEDDKGETQAIRAFVNIRSDDGQGYYCHTERILDDPELHDNVMAQILADLVALKNKHAKYKHPRLQKIWDALEEAVVA